MTTLLEQAIDQLRRCSPAEQDTIAALILEEIADDTHWKEAIRHAADHEEDDALQQPKANLRQLLRRKAPLDDQHDYEHEGNENRDDLIHDRTSDAKA